MYSVTAGGPGLVAVGQAGSFVQRAAVWTSPDGIAWSRIPHDDTLFEGAIMSGATAGGPGLVAVGHSEPNAAVWTSPDGITCSRVPHDGAVFGGDTDDDYGVYSMSSVTAGGPGLVAVGRDPFGAAVWTSGDGLTWFRVPHTDEVFGGGDHLEMRSVTVGGPVWWQRAIDRT
jgi:hypothetical protein